MLKDVLPEEIERLIRMYVNYERLIELRFRKSYPIVLNISNRIYGINNNGLCALKEGIIASKEIIEKIIFIASENSIYASINQIKNGFLSAKNGIRIGLGGEVVYENGQVSNLRNISYLNIRIPHEIDGCARSIYPLIYEDEKVLHNTLILAPPGVGKTTLLRDLIKHFSTSKNYLNCLVLDERYEIVGKNSGDYAFNLGANVDVLFGAEKSFGFQSGIRTMSPNVIFTDEIATKKDIESIVYASTCGVNVIATMHAFNLQDFLNKSELTDIIKHSIFSRYVVLSKRNGIGTIEGVFNQEFRLIYRE